MATKNIVPRATDEGRIGKSDKKWNEVNASTGSFGRVTCDALVSENPIHAKWYGEGDSIFGWTRIGYDEHTGHAGIGHVLMGGNEYMILQSTNGETMVNAATGYPINFRIQNDTKMVIKDSSGNSRVGIGTTNPSYDLHVSGTIKGNEIYVDGTISGSTITPTRSYLHFGYDPPVTANNETITIYPNLAGGSNTGGVANGQGYRMMRDGKVTGVSCQFDVTDASPNATLSVRVYKNASTSTDVFTQSATLSSITDYGMFSLANEVSFEAGDTIYCRGSLVEGDSNDVIVDDIAILIEIQT